MNSIGERLRWIRKRRVLSQEQLAEKSKVPVVTISRIENDHQVEPRPSTVQKLSTALGVEPAWLMFGDEAELKIAA